MNPLIKSVLSEIDRIAAFVPSAGLLAKDVSKWSIGQHIEHVAKATSAIAVALLRHKASSLPPDDNPLKSTLLDQGSFPRGIVDAPDITLPSEEIRSEALESLLLKTRNRVGKLDGLQPEAAAEHHYLGMMQRDESIEFLAIHLRHHISIIEDIVKASS